MVWFVLLVSALPRTAGKAVLEGREILGCEIVTEILIVELMFWSNFSEKLVVCVKVV